jgi:hypothetical protein
MWEASAPSPMPVLLAAQGWCFFVCPRGTVPFHRCQPVAGSANIMPAQLRTMVLERETRRQASFLVAAVVVAAGSAAARLLRGAGVARAAGGSIPPPPATQAVPVSSSRRHTCVAPPAAVPAAAAGRLSHRHCNSSSDGRVWASRWAEQPAALILFPKCSCPREEHCLHVRTALSFVCPNQT